MKSCSTCCTATSCHCLSGAAYRSTCRSCRSSCCSGSGPPAPQAPGDTDFSLCRATSFFIESETSAWRKGWAHGVSQPTRRLYASGASWLKGETSCRPSLFVVPVCTLQREHYSSLHPLSVCLFRLSNVNNNRGSPHAGAYQMARARHSANLPPSTHVGILGKRLKVLASKIGGFEGGAWNLHGFLAHRSSPAVFAAAAPWGLSSGSNFTSFHLSFTDLRYLKM